MSSAPTFGSPFKKIMDIAATVAEEMEFLRRVNRDLNVERDFFKSLYEGGLDQVRALQMKLDEAGLALAKIHNYD